VVIALAVGALALAVYVLRQLFAREIASAEH
jgi:hypothetical protein